MRIGIIGSGNIGGAAAKLFADAGHEVLLSHAGDPEAIRSKVEPLGARASAVTVERAIAAGDVVLLAVPWRNRGDLPADRLRGKITIDAMNPYKPDHSTYDLGDSTSSEEVAKTLAGARLVKAFNHLYAKDLASKGRRDLPASERTAMFVAGDDQDAKQAVAGLIRDLGYAPLDTGACARADGCSRREGPSTRAS